MSDEPKKISVEVSKVEADYVALLAETEQRAIAEAKKRTNDGIKDVLTAHGHEWPGTEIGLRDVGGKHFLEWVPKEENDGPDHTDAGTAGRPEGSPGEG